MHLMKLEEVEDQVGLKSSQIHRLIEMGLFPTPVPLTDGSRRWLVHAIEQRLRGRLALSLKVSGKRKTRRRRSDDDQADDESPPS